MVLNLSRKNLCSPKLPFYQKDLNLSLIQKKLLKLNRELKEYGRELRLMWHFRNDERPFSYKTCKPKSTFNRRNKDAIIETYLSCLERFGIRSKKFNNLIKDGHKSL